MGLRAWRSGLFTHEDPVNVHKLFGFPCLAHFVFRTACVLRDWQSDMSFDGSNTTLACIVCHMCLSLSSLVFHLPKVRIKEGSRIWPEFRLHSIVFAMRSLAAMMIVFYERRTGSGPYYWANVVVVFATLAAADLATNSVDPKSRSNTIRGLKTSPVYQFAFSQLQFLGTCGVLVGLRYFAAQFAIVFIIQIYAFTLTLRRKNLVSHQATVYLYSYQLTFGTTISLIEVVRSGGVDAIFMFGALAGFAFALRARVGLNKYAVWAIMSVIVQYARRTTTIVPVDERIIGWPVWGWPAALACIGVVLAQLLRQKIAAAEERELAEAKEALDESKSREVMAG